MSDDGIFWALKQQKVHWKVAVLSKGIRDAYGQLR